jgi:hypothetical protein
VTTHSGFWQSFKRAINGEHFNEDARRVTVREADAYTLPADVHHIRVLTGGAWVSHLREDIILYPGQSMQLHPERDAVVVTAIGCEPVMLEMSS